jgi:Ni/Co efflux regulator RcnB
MKASTLIRIAATAALGFASLAHAQGEDINWKLQDPMSPEYWRARNMPMPANPAEAARYAPPISQNPIAPERQTPEQRQHSERYGHPYYGQPPYYGQQYGGPPYYGQPYGQQYGQQYGQGRYFQQGSYVPAEYRSSRYAVNDWRARRLPAPPQGYQWIQTDAGNYALISIATGLVANVVLNAR